MASAPPTFPVWLVASDGVTPIFVNDLPSYNAAIAAGATFAPTTPTVALASGGGATASVVQLPLNPSQPLPAPDASLDAGVSC